MTTYRVRVKKIDFEIPTRYTDLKFLGGGSYGVVCSAFDAQRQGTKHHKVALKRIGGVFRDVVDAKRILREMKLLRHLRGHANVVGILDLFQGQPMHRRFKDVYMVTSLYESDLYKIIVSQQALSAAHARYFMYQILRGLKWIHSANIIHRDLKPANLLINSDCGLAICDFGLARGIQSLNDSMRTAASVQQMADAAASVQLTHYVVTRWYRAPELLAENANYGKAIDMWSVGCILGEILGRRVLFRGRDYLDQLMCVLKTIGTPDESEMYFVSKQECRQAIRSMGRRTATPWKRLFPNAEPSALDLLGKLLTFDPAKRLTVEEALRHPYVSEYHDASREPTCGSSFNFDFEQGGNLSAAGIRELMVSEMRSITQSAVAAPAQASAKGAAGGSAAATEGNHYASPPGRTSNTKRSRLSRSGSSGDKRRGSAGRNRRSPPPAPQAPAAVPPSSPSHATSTAASIARAAGTAAAAAAVSAAAAAGAVTRDELSSAVDGMLSEISERAVREREAIAETVRGIVSSEVQAMEQRLLSSMRSIVDDVVVQRLSEFERRLEEGEEDDSINEDVRLAASGGGGISDVDMMALSQATDRMSVESQAANGGGQTPEARILNRRV